jgi:hypothetical protein
MPSAAAIKYRELTTRASVILKADRRKLGKGEVQALYGAAFVAQTAAWNAYVVRLVDCFFQEVANPAVASFHAMHTLANSIATSHFDRFSTPNAENTRNLILTSTGYDPWTDWQWPAHGMSGLAVRNRLNEILKVRHSLAHGFAMPAYHWNQTASGEIRLTLYDFKWMRTFLNYLTASTERGMKLHLNTVYAIAPNW